ncbi:hypothetical protein [Pseudoalteromonas sp. R3]|uniref:hypothetical protein n=1 Tax=Pseudoalteromonas sp. R3 TaxID=1709477 RepID=UPI0006B552FC|nr:hypothetical protein [Pseudoalteromonas sp. R3]AZZ95961.1 hypothetical protein ELR70_01790 [Pseudoalteromonas sp. R3]
MIEFLKILFLSKFVLLTPEPITINGQYEFNLTESIDALNYNARINIDVTAMMGKFLEVDVVEKLDILSEKFPKGSVVVHLIESSAGDKVTLKNLGYSTSENSMDLSLKYPKNAELGKSYDTIIIESNVLLKEVVIGWANSK